MQYFEVSGSVRYYINGAEQQMDISARLDAADSDSAAQAVLDNLAEELAAREEVSITQPRKISGIEWAAPPAIRVLTDTCLE
jgi:hypothetical protein